MTTDRYSFRLNPPRVYERLPDGGQAIYVLQPEGSRIVVTQVVVEQPRPHGVSVRDVRERRPAGAVAAFRVFLLDRIEHPPSDDATTALLELGKEFGWSEEDFRAVLERSAAEDPWRSVIEHLRRNTLLHGDRLVRLAVTAAMYVAAIADGERAPNEAVARVQGRSASHVRDDLKRARDAGLLTSSGGRGMAGGDLTPQATAIIEKELSK